MNCYIFSCGNDGKTFSRDIKSGKLVFTFTVNIDITSDIAFSSNEDLVVTCSYDRKISVFLLLTMIVKRKLKAYVAAESAWCYIIQLDDSAR